QFWIDDGDAGQQVMTSQTDLDAALWYLEHGVAGDLGAGAGRGGNGDPGSRGAKDRTPHAHDFKVIHHLARVVQHARHGLASITLPPPTAITNSQPSSRARSVASSTSPTVGSPSTWKGIERTPAWVRPAASDSLPRPLRPNTRSANSPRLFSGVGSWREVPV